MKRRRKQSLKYQTKRHEDDLYFDELEHSRTIAMNRKQRRALAKRAGVRYSVVKEGMLKQPPTYLGIRQFKKAAGNNKKLVSEYKENAYLSPRELRERRAIEDATITKAKEVNLETIK